MLEVTEIVIILSLSFDLISIGLEHGKGNINNFMEYKKMIKIFEKSNAPRWLSGAVGRGL